MGHISDVKINLGKLQDILRGFEIERKNSKLRKEANEIIGIIYDKYYSVEKYVEFDEDKLEYLDNNINGVFDGLTDTPIRTSYIRSILRSCISQIDKILVDWEPYEDKRAKEPKKEIKTSKNWKEALEQVKSTMEKEETKGKTEEEREQERWDEDELVLKDFLSTPLNKVKKKGLLRVPVVLGQRLSNNTIEILEQHNFKTAPVFQGYTLIKNLPVYGVSKEFADMCDEQDDKIIAHIMAKVNAKRSKKLTVVSEGYWHEGYWYYLLMPKGVHSGLTVEEWSFMKPNVQEAQSV